MAARTDAFRTAPEAAASEVPLQRLLPIEGAAEYLGVSRATVERLVSRGKLPIVKVAGFTRYTLRILMVSSRAIDVAIARTCRDVLSAPEYFG
jgi:excisionase family DNA binding protein